MEELRSTEILDKEIQADARKKAENILKKAANTCEDILNSLEKNIEDAKLLKQDFYNKKLSSFQKNQDASIPLEKRRFEVSFVQKAISENINKYLDNLGEEKRIQLVLNQLVQIKDSISEKSLNAYVYGFDEKKVQPVLSKALGKNLLKCEKTDFGRISVEEDNTNFKEGIILETESKDFRVRLTISQIVTQLFEQHREELCAALFGAGGLE